MTPKTVYLFVLGKYNSRKKFTNNTEHRIVLSEEKQLLAVEGGNCLRMIHNPCDKAVKLHMLMWEI